MINCADWSVTATAENPDQAAQQANQED